MREIAVVAEGERHRRRRRQQHRIRAHLVVRRHDGEGGRCGDAQREVVISSAVTSGMSPGTVSMPPRPSRGEQARRRRDRRGVTVARDRVDTSRAVALRQCGGAGIRRHHQNAGETARRRERRSTSSAHGQREPGAQCARHEPRQALLGVAGLLDRNHGPDVCAVGRSARASPSARPRSRARRAPVLPVGEVAHQRLRHPRMNSSAASHAASALVDDVAIDDVTITVRDGGASTGRPSSRIILAVGPFTASPPTIGDTAITGAGLG